MTVKQLGQFIRRHPRDNTQVPRELVLPRSILYRNESAAPGDSWGGSWGDSWGNSWGEP
jgi:hypothetical protein